MFERGGGGGGGGALIRIHSHDKTDQTTKGKLDSLLIPLKPVGPDEFN